MRNRKYIVACIGLAVAGGCLLFACKATRHSAKAPSVVTGDIQQGIEAHIAREVEKGGGYFRTPFEGGELKLKLVRVHVEYLASLGPQYHFACVDMVGADGEFYDVDFFLSGDPGSMVVTETMVHKINGQPLYVWEQKPDKTWGRTPVEEADKALLGVLTDKDAFEFRYEATIPELTAPARMWVPLAETDAAQKIEVKSINIPGEHQLVRDTRYGNRILFATLRPEDSGKKVEVVYHVERVEKGAYEGDPADAAQYLAGDLMVPITDQIRKLAREAVEDKDDDLMKARALYDHVIDAMRYQKHGDGWGRGDAVYACDARFGNCTDYHSYFIALARAVGIPARFAIGAAIPSERDEGGVDGYHCWAEFYADGKWWPVDISEADKFTSLSAYYFGHHPANRIELSRGRDLVVDPAPQSGPINFLAYPLVEVEGRPVKAKPFFSFNRAGSGEG